MCVRSDHLNGTSYMKDGGKGVNSSLGEMISLTCQLFIIIYLWTKKNHLICTIEWRGCWVDQVLPLQHLCLRCATSTITYMRLHCPSSSQRASLPFTILYFPFWQRGCLARSILDIYLCDRTTPYIRPAPYGVLFTHNPSFRPPIVSKSHNFPIKRANFHAGINRSPCKSYINCVSSSIWW